MMPYCTHKTMMMIDAILVKGLNDTVLIIRWMMLNGEPIQFNIIPRWGGASDEVDVSANGRGTSPLDWSPRGVPWSQATYFRKAVG